MKLLWETYLHTFLHKCTCLLSLKHKVCWYIYIFAVIFTLKDQMSWILKTLKYLFSNFIFLIVLCNMTNLVKVYKEQFNTKPIHIFSDLYMRTFQVFCLLNYSGVKTGLIFSQLTLPTPFSSWTLDFLIHWQLTSSFFFRLCLFCVFWYTERHPSGNVSSLLKSHYEVSWPISAALKNR